MMGRVSIVISLAPAIGPTMSGFLLDTRRLALDLRDRAADRARRARRRRRWIHNLGETTHAPIDVLSVVLSALGFGGIVFGLSQIGGAAAHGGSAADAAAADAMSALTLIVVPRVGVDRARPVRLAAAAPADAPTTRCWTCASSVRATSRCRSRRWAVLSLAFFGAITVVPLYLQSVLQVSALDTGLVVLPGALAMGLPGRSSGASTTAGAPACC